MSHSNLLAALLFAAVASVWSHYGVVPVDHHAVQNPCLQWTGGSFHWPCASTKSLYKSSGKYVSKNVIATRAQAYKDELFLALPRYKPGVPATLVKTQLRKGSCHTTLTPFPCWSMQEEGNCHSLQSVVDLVLDSNEVLWVLDTGIINTLENPIRKCAPKVVAFCVKTGKVLKILSLEGLVCNTSRLQYLAVDYNPNGRCYVYVSDAASRAIIVYDVQASSGFRVVLPKAVVQGCSRRDVLYIALARKSCGTHVLYFTYLGSKRMFSIKTEHLCSGHAQGHVTGKHYYIKNRLD